MTETEPPISKGIVIFGATGDLCKRKLIPALYNLWKKNLLPKNFVITGSSRRDPGVQAWKDSLGDYPEEFFYQLDYISTDLDNVDTLRHFLITSTIILISYRFLPRDMVTRLLTSKKQDSSTTQTAPVLLLRNPLGTILNLLVIYSLWWGDIYAKSRSIALIIILAKILLTIFLLRGLVTVSYTHLTLPTKRIV